MIDDHGQVPVALSMREVINPDPRKTGERVAPGDLLGGDALADQADRAPRDAHQLRDGLLGRVNRQPAALVLQRDREAGVMPRPRDRGDDHAMVLAVHARPVGLQVGERRPEVQRPPAPASLAGILARAAPPAHAAAVLLPRARADRHHDRLQLNADVLDHRPLDPEQHLPYASPAHAASALSSVPTVRSRTVKAALLLFPWVM